MQHGYPNFGFAASLTLLLVATILSLVGCGVALVYIFVERRFVRVSYRVVVAVLATVTLALLVYDPALCVSYLSGRIADGRAVMDFPILTVTKYAVPLNGFVFVAPVIRKYLRPRFHG